MDALRLNYVEFFRVVKGNGFFILFFSVFIFLLLMAGLIDVYCFFEMCFGNSSEKYLFIVSIRYVIMNCHVTCFHRTIIFMIVL